MLCWHVVSYAKLLERETNAHSLVLCKHAQPSLTDTRNNCAELISALCYIKTYRHQGDYCGTEV